MNFRKNKVFGPLVLLPLSLFFVGTSAAVDTNPYPDEGKSPDLVITEDTQLALKGKNGRAILGSCQTADPLWRGKIALKNIGPAPVIVKNERTNVEPSVPEERRDLLTPERKDRLTPGTETILEGPHLRVYVPNNIELKAETSLTHTLREFGQELLVVEIGRDQPKCRNYGPPPVFDSRYSGRRGRVPVKESKGHDGPKGGPHWGIKRIQRALIEKGYTLRSGVDGDYGWETAKAVLDFLKRRGETPPPEIRQSPLSPEMIDYLLDLLDPKPELQTEINAGGVGGDECIKGINHVSVYVEIDPDRTIANENRANNRVQFTVEIDCSSVAGR